MFARVWHHWRQWKTPFSVTLTRTRAHTHPTHKKECYHWLEETLRRDQSSIPVLSLVRLVQYLTSQSVKLFCPFRSPDTDRHTQPGCLLQHSAALHRAIPKIQHANDTKTLVQREKVSRCLHNCVVNIFFFFLESSKAEPISHLEIRLTRLCALWSFMSSRTSERLIFNICFVICYNFCRCVFISAFVVCPRAAVTADVRALVRHCNVVTWLIVVLQTSTGFVIVDRSKSTKPVI